MTSRRRNTAPRVPFAISDEWRAAFETQCTRELLHKAERFAKRRARKLSMVGVVVDDYYARELVQDVLGDTTTGLLRWDPSGEPLEDHVMDAIATRVHHEVARARRFLHVSLDDDDPAVSGAILAAADASLLAASEASHATVRLADNAFHELWALTEADPEVRRLLGALASGATRKADVQHATGMSAQDYHAARNRLDRLVGRLSRDARTVPMTDTLLAALKALDTIRTGFVIRNLDGTAMTDNQTKYHCYRLCRTAGLPERGWHNLRHAFGTHAAMFGVNPWKLMLWMGHKRIDETMLYVHFAEAHLRPLPEPILSAQRGHDDPDKKVIAMLAARANGAQRGSNVAVKPGLRGENALFSYLVGGADGDLKTRAMLRHDTPRTEFRELGVVGGLPSVAEHHGAPADCSDPAAAAADPIAAELEAALTLRRSGADPRALRRALRRIEELLDG